MIVLRFRHDSTTSEWQFDGMDERALRQMLGDLSPYSVQPDSNEAVLSAATGDGKPIGWWSRGGAAHLASMMFRERTTPPWSEVEAAIQSAVMDPHPEGESAPAA
jgi:hypothetical protein